MKWYKKTKDSKIYDIKTFIDKNRTYLFSLIIGFCLISRLIALASIVMIFDQISKIEFWVKMIFNNINILTLIIAFKSIMLKKQK